MTRIDGRSPSQLRPTTITPGFLAHAEGSVLIEVGRTRVICTASVEDRVPQFLRNTGKGWVTAEYGMLPRATDLSDRPISRWISCVRPPTFPVVASRVLRVLVARGSIPYSAVPQPLPVLRRNCGTRSSTLAVQITFVRPASMNTEPSACGR